MDLTNGSYHILLKSGSCCERYYKDSEGWLKVSSQGREFRMTAEQVLNHILPVLSGVKRCMAIEVVHRDAGSCD